MKTIGAGRAGLPVLNHHYLQAMKGSYIWAVMIVVVCAIISLDLWRLWKEEAKTEQIKAVKDQLDRSIYIDSLRTSRLMDSLIRISNRQEAQKLQLEAFNRAVRIQNQQTRKQNENLIIQIDSLRGIINDRPEF